MYYKINKKLSRFITAAIAATFIGNSFIIPKANAQTGKDYSEAAARVDVAVDKVWRIKFNKEIEETSVNEENVKVYDYGKEEYMPVEVSLGIDKRYLTVKLKSGTYKGDHYDGRYEYGKKYMLEIKKDIKSKAKPKEEKKNMLYDLRMDFTTRLENPYPGIPAENGTIIMKDKAYSIDYLEKNSEVANDIIKNGDYEAYFIYSKDEERIRKLLGDEYNNSNSDSKKSDIITYYSGDGSQHIYQWNETSKEYKLVPAAVFADITPSSDTGLVNITVKSVSAVPGAKYYKLKHSNNVKSIPDTTTFISSTPLEEISILSSNETVLAKGVLDVSRDASRYFNLITIDETLGTDAGNSNNNGSFVMNEDLDTIYRNTGDKKTMYKKDLTGGIDNQISLDNPQYLNALGQWIYYSNYSDNGKIYKVKKDGTGRQKICEDTATYLIVSGNQIFYSNHSDKGRLYVINTDGSGGTVDSAGNVHGKPVMTSTGSYDKSAYDEVSYLNIIGDWIYYTNVSDGHKIYVVNKDGTARRKVNDEWSEGVQIVGDWAYYASATGVLSKVRKDGTGTVVPIRGKTPEVDKSYHFNVVGDYLYYSNAEDGGKLYKISTDGSGETHKLSDIKTDYINIIGNFIYMITSNQTKSYMLPIDTDGTVKPVLITKNSLDSKIAKVDNIKKFVDYNDVNLPLKTLELKYLPPKIPALMTDDTYKEVTVSWDVDNVKYRDGVYTYTGTILGYGQKVTLELNIPSEMLNDTNKIILNNNAGKNDTVEIIGTIIGNPSSVRLKVGDSIFIYEDEDCSKLLGKGTVGANKNALISRLDLDPDGESVYITVKREGKGESKPTEVKQIEAPFINGDVEDNDEIGLALDGRDFSISSWSRGKFAIGKNYDGYSINGQKLFILPSRSNLDMKNQTPIASSDKYDRGLTVNSTSWVGTKEMYIKKDSVGRDFKNGAYDIFVATGYSGFASPDSSGFEPLMEGYISTAVPKNITVLGEVLPDRPSLSNQTVVGEGEFTLSRMPKDDEVIWIIPEEEEYKVNGWKTEDGTEDPFKILMYASKAISIDKGEELIAPQGLDSNIANYRDRKYKIFFVNKVGASESSVGTLTVDNRKPRLLEVSGVSIAAGENLTVKSSEEGTAYLVGQGIDDSNIESLEAAVRTSNGLRTNVSSNGSTFTSIGTNISKLQNITSDQNSKNYKLVLVDKTGNISGKVKDITIWRSDVEDELLGAISEGNDVLDDLNAIDDDTIPAITPVGKMVKRNLPRLISSAQKVYSNKNSSEKDIQRTIIDIWDEIGDLTEYGDLEIKAKLKEKILSAKLNNIMKPSDIIRLNTISGVDSMIDIIEGEDLVEKDSNSNNIKLIKNELPISDEVVKLRVTLTDKVHSSYSESKDFYVFVKGDNPVGNMELKPEGDNYIDINGGKLIVNAYVLPSGNTLPVDFKDITFAVTDENGKSTDRAEIDKTTGILTAKKNGKVKIKATINNNYGGLVVTAELTIEITNQMLDITNTVYTVDKDSEGKGILTIKNLPDNKDITIVIRKTSSNEIISEIKPDVIANITRNNTSVIIKGLDFKNEASIQLELSKPNLNTPEPVIVSVPN